MGNGTGVAQRLRNRCASTVRPGLRGTGPRNGDCCGQLLLPGAPSLLGAPGGPWGHGAGRLLGSRWDPILPRER